MINPEPSRSGARDNPLIRLLGSVLSWLLFSLSFTLLVQAVFGVMSVGGACASGNTPYVIAHQCPDVTVWATPAVFGGLASVALGVWLAQGFGTSLANLAWPILFGVLGGVFVSSFELVGYILGGMFLIMALVPLVLSLRASAQRVFLGAVNLRGQRFVEGERSRPTPLNFNFASSENPVAATFGNWALSLVLWIGSSALGFWLALKLAGGV
jgi:hypothetical protein